MKKPSAKLLVLSLLTIMLAFVVIAHPLAQQRFETPISQVPFASIAVHHEIDDRCPSTGRRDNNIYHYAQNAAKNNFTAKGKPVKLSFDDFTNMQKATQKKIEMEQIKFVGKYPADRTQLTNLIKVKGKSLGEGTLVSLEAYVFRSFYANTKFSHDDQGRPATGEAVDCDSPELDWNDIHIALSANPSADTDQCTTVTAEISPHYRPVVWSKFHDGLNADIENILPGLLQHRVVAQQKAVDQPLRVRITGPLFYDASHKPCEFNGNNVTARNSPERRTIWEIHPIYRIQVYDTARRRWVELDQWSPT